MRVVCAKTLHARPATIAAARTDESRLAEPVSGAIDPIGMPTPIDATTEAALLEGLESPAVEMTDADWDAKLRRYERRSRRRSAGEGAA